MVSERSLPPALHARRPIVFGAGLWRLLETAFFIFMFAGAVAGLSYLYKPVLNLIRKRGKSK